MSRLTELYNYLKSGGNFYSVDFESVFPDSVSIVMGVDEFSGDKEFIKEFFDLSEDSYNYLFVPGAVSITSIEGFIIHLKGFIDKSF